MSSGVRHSPTRVSAKNPAEKAHSGVHKFLGEVLKERWRKYRKALKRCRKDYCENSIHQMRIETRRILALVDLLHPFHPLGLQRVEARFKKLFKSSASLRDTQVQLSYLENDLELFPEIRPFRKHLCKREKRLRKIFRKTVAAGPKPKLKRSVASLRRWFQLWRQKTALDAADSKKLLEGVQVKYANVSKARGAVNGSLPATIHRLRVAFKAYRYMVELLEPFLKGLTATQLNAMRDYQGLMGDIQDVEVLLGAVKKFQSKHPRHTLDIYRAELERRHDKLIARFLSARLPSLTLPVCFSAAARNGN